MLDTEGDEMFNTQTLLSGATLTVALKQQKGQYTYVYTHTHTHKIQKTKTSP